MIAFLVSSFLQFLDRLVQKVTMGNIKSEIRVFALWLAHL